jgi:hypothetical protein
MESDTVWEMPTQPAYNWYRKQLQLLSYQLGEEESKRPRRWMLKCPMHLFFTKSIAGAFPDAKLVWTHRKPQSAVPSLCSLIRAFHQVYFEADGRDDAQMGRKVAATTAELLRRAPKEMAQTGLESAHVLYDNLIADPREAVRALYLQFGWEFTKEYSDLLDAYITENTAEREKLKSARQGSAAALHSYSAEDFGLTAEELGSGAFADYSERFGLRR